jgi:hypothetical protein
MKVPAFCREIAKSRLLEALVERTENGRTGRALQPEDQLAP